MSRLTRDGTAEPVSRDQILRHARGQGNVHFPCSADHEQDWQPYPVDPYSAICDDHTYIHTYIRVLRVRSVVWPSSLREQCTPVRNAAICPQRNNTQKLREKTPKQTTSSGAPLFFFLMFLLCSCCVLVVDDLPPLPSPPARRRR